MRIDPEIKMDFCDVLLKPKRSTLNSRKEVNLYRTFKFKYAQHEWTGVPIISANMSSVTTPAVAEAMFKHSMLACTPKYKELDFTGLLATIIPSIGLQPLKAVNAKYDWLALDVPNGHIEAVVEQTKKMREAFPYMILIVGNVATAEMTEALILAGADIVKVGIGSGSACSTRIKTGVGMPQLSAIIECADAAHGLGGHIISDGGCTVPGDVSKAFAAGADFVMLGSMLSGCLENGREFYGMSSERANNELSGTTCNVCGGIGKTRSGDLGDSIRNCSHCKGTGKIGGLKDYRASEGFEMLVPDKGPIEKVLQDIEGGLRSSCSYLGAKSIKELPKRATFIRVNNQVNKSLWKYRV